MNGNRGLERYKGTLLLIAVVLVVMIVAWRGMHVAFSDSAETETSATASTRSRLPVTTSADNDETNDDPSAAIPINLADVPVYTDDSLVPALNPNTYQGKLPSTIYKHMLLSVATRRAALLRNSILLRKHCWAGMNFSAANPVCCKSVSH